VNAARKNDRPALAHVGIALAFQAATAAPIVALERIARPLLDLPVALGSLALAIGATAGALVAVGFYLGRERRQAEEEAGSNRIPPWQWGRRTLRDLGWPSLAVAATTALAWWNAAT
jgi:hypothetical protein